MFGVKVAFGKLEHLMTCLQLDRPVAFNMQPGGYRFDGIISTIDVKDRSNSRSYC